MTSRFTQAATFDSFQSKPSWTPLSRFGFRFACCYLLLSWLTVYGILTVIPLFGYQLEGWIDRIWEWPVLWLGQHVFHLTGIAAQPHPTDSRDTALSWIAAGLVAPTALLCAAVWSVIDRRRSDYETTSQWLRYVLRLALIFLMARYGLMKIFPLQMAPPSLAVLNEPVGNTSPMTLLWTLLGLHPWYEMLAGGLEAAAAMLLFFRRTALLGALLTIAIMVNVLLYNLFFDVPVKLGAINVLILAVAILAPDLRALYGFAVLRESVRLTSEWVPVAAAHSSRLALKLGELVFVAFALIQFVPNIWAGWRQQQAQLQHPSPLSGEWHVDSVLQTRGDRQISLPVLTAEGKPMTDIILEPNGLVMVRSDDGKLWRAQAQIDRQERTFQLGSGYFQGERFSAGYRMVEPDANHLILEPTGPAVATNGTIALTRIPLPVHYPLLEREFHWVNEWALER